MKKLIISEAGGPVLATVYLDLDQNFQPVIEILALETKEKIDEFFKDLFSDEESATTVEESVSRNGNLTHHRMRMVPHRRSDPDYLDGLLEEINTGPVQFIGQKAIEATIES